MSVSKDCHRQFEEATGLHFVIAILTVLAAVFVRDLVPKRAYCHSICVRYVHAQVCMVCVYGLRSVYGLHSVYGLYSVCTGIGCTSKHRNRCVYNGPPCICHTHLSCHYSLFFA